MRYEAIRPDIKSGDVLAWSHKKWNSFYDLQVQAVRFFTQSEYCHVGVAWVTSGRVYVIEAVSPFVRIFPLSKLLPFYYIRTSDYWTPEIEEFANSKIGESYSKKQAIMAFLNKLKNGDDANWECAELVVKILSDGNILDINTQSTPSNVVLELQKKDYPMYLIE